MKRYFITCIPHLFIGETEENFLKWPKPLLLISSSAKMKDVGSGGTVVKSLLVKKHNKQGQGYGFSSGHVWM